mmetsp:Transcript_27877/g.65524  ORF Transcript_27877/g.65524 Transcript_27877/m.65524 type:complete len:113 (+) Transcript_27877:1614-1952(+)
MLGSRRKQTNRGVSSLGALPWALADREVVVRVPRLPSSIERFERRSAIRCGPRVVIPTNEGFGNTHDDESFRSVRAGIRRKPTAGSKILLFVHTCGVHTAHTLDHNPVAITG